MECVEESFLSASVQGSVNVEEHPTAKVMSGKPQAPSTLVHLRWHGKGAFGSQASRINPGQKEPGKIAKEYDGDQKIHQCTHVGERAPEEVKREWDAYR
ncbi:hypothetical protein E5288_WYG021237 [Bos mutus]|uniref:Uncharacterized protein n=1 Tax=Bos mutus TaxID=72004 RepID=A0A6B0SAE7_9CETA|nr:hypothetical protein [Bos mutus]